MRFLGSILCLIWCALIPVDCMEVRRTTMDVRQSETRYVKLLRNCSRAALVTESPYVDVRFRGDCSSEFVRVTHLGFHQPREIILEFVVELRNVSLLSLKVNVHENPRLKSLFKKSPKLPTLKPNQTLSKVLNLSGCEARVRRNTRKVPLLGLCGDDPYLWRSCRDILDVFTDSAEPDDVVLAVKLVDYDELNIAIAFSPSTSPPDLAFSSLLRVQVIPRVLSAVRRQVLSTEDRDSFFRTVQLPASCTFVRALTQTKVTQFAQQDIDDLSIALFCRKTAHDAMVQLELVNMLGQTSEPFFVTLSTPVDIGFSYNGLVLTGMKSAAQLEVTSSRDGEIRVLDGLRRGILLADGSPVDSFGTNMSLDYSVHGISTDISRTITTDNLVLDFCSLHFVVPVLLVPYEEPRFQLNPVRVVPGRQVVLSPKHVQFNSIHIGDFEFVLAGHPDGGRLTVNSIAVNNFSSSALLDLKVSFQAFRNASNSETLTLFYAVPGGEFPEVASLAIDFIAPKEDRTAPQPFDCSLQLVAHPRNVRVPLEKGNLRFIDDGDTSCAREVTYNVTSKNSALNGYLGDANGQQISSFTQGDINQGSVFYFPPNIFRRVGGQKTAFEFRVSDAMGNTGPTNCLQVYLEALKISKTVSKQIVCRQDVAFGAELLSSGYNSSSTKFGVTALPKSGRLVKTKDDVKEDLVVGDSFTQSDLLAGYISYHSLFMPTSDTFELLAVNSKDHVLRKRKVRRLRLKRRKFKRNALQYFKVVVNLRSDDHMTGTEGRQELSIELLVDEGRKSNIVQDGSNFTLMTPPRHGQVFIATERNDKAQITYVHSGDEIGFEEQKDKFVVGHSKGVAEVYVRITPVDNLAPVIDAAGSYKVKEAASVSLTIKISDADSKAAWCHITDPPSYGRVTVDRLGPLGLINDTFTEHILYQQTVHSFVEPTDDQFALTCSDGINISRPTFINISVIPQNDEIPSLKVNNVTVIEGREAPIKLTASDGDLPPDELNFRISHLPSHGVVGLLQPNGNVEPIVSFSEHNLTLLFYAHDDSDNLRDSFEVVVSDGVHSMRQKVEVNVLAIDDEAPVLVANRGLQVLIGRAAKITPLDLQVADADSDPGSVRVYIVKQPRHGAVWRTDSISNRNQTAIASFSYQDLVLGLISYVHTSVVCCSDDEFLFSLTDGFNESPSYVFNVSVIRPPTADKSTNISYQTLSTTLINCSQRLPELNADSADIEWIEMFPTHGPVNGKLDITDTGLKGVTFEYTLKAELAEDATNDTFSIFRQKASNKVENITMNVYWCWLKLSAPSDVSAGETLTLELHRSGIKHTLTEGVLETPVGELPFSILPNVLTKFVPLHVPESLAGQRFSVRLSAVQGCLLHSICPSDQTVSIIVLSSRKDVHFENDAVNVPEPQTPYSKETFFVRVKRKPSPRRMDLKFRFYTIDGTARANEDFVPVDEVVTLKAKDDDISVPVEILGDNQLEAVEFFHIFIEPLSEHVQFRARVDIEDSPSRLAFHSRPLVFAVDPGTGELLPHSKLLQKGTILYCATECDPHHPQYSCSGETLNSSVIRYEWKSLVQTTEENQKSFFSRSFSAIKSRSYLTRTNRKILPGFLYLPEASKVICSARLTSIHSKEPDGYWVNSEPYLIGMEALCGGRAGSRPFSSKLSLDENSSCSERDLFSFELTVPHHDGAISLWSTKPISPGDYQRALFATKHVCSNIFQANASEFLTALDLHSCTWHYKRLFSLNELLACGAQLYYGDGRGEHEEDFLHVSSSTITISLPVHVMYVSNAVAGRWQHITVTSVLHVAFIYSNLAVGTGSVVQLKDAPMSGTADIDSIGVDSRENLVVNFQTSINFRGRLVAEKSEERWNESLLILSPRDGVQGAFVLRLEKQLSTAKVSWSLRSLAKLSRYSGNYSLAFYPCVGTSNEKCEVKPELAPLQFVLPVELETVQGTKQPLYPIVSFMELTLADRWLQTEIQDDHASIQVGPNDTFNKGEKVFGVVRSVLNGSSAKIFPLLTRIRQCFLCYSTARSTGASRPTEAKNQVLSCPHKIIDCEASKHPTDLSTMERSLRGSLASQNRQSFLPEIMERLDSLGADAFTFDTDSLFVWKSNGEDLSWHVHCIFAVAKEHDAGKGRPQRNIAPPNGLGDIILQKSLALHLGDLNPVAPQESDDGYPSLATAYSNVVAVFFGAALILVLGAAILNARQKKHVASSIYRTVPLAEQCFTLPVNTWDYQRETLL